jgi:hypothetical protein
MTAKASLNEALQHQCGRMKSKANLVPLAMMARILCVPAKWLRSEAEAERLPHLKAGSRLLFNRNAVQRALLKRATESGTHT